LAAVLHINKSNAAGNSKRLYTPDLEKVSATSYGTFSDDYIATIYKVVQSFSETVTVLAYRSRGFLSKI